MRRRRADAFVRQRQIHKDPGVEQLRLELTRVVGAHLFASHHGENHIRTLSLPCTGDLDDKAPDIGVIGYRLDHRVTDQITHGLVDDLNLLPPAQGLGHTALELPYLFVKRFDLPVELGHFVLLGQPRCAQSGVELFFGLEFVTGDCRVRRWFGSQQCGILINQCSGYLSHPAQLPLGLPLNLREHLAPRDGTTPAAAGVCVVVLSHETPVCGPACLRTPAVSRDQAPHLRHLKSQIFFTGDYLVIHVGDAAQAHKPQPRRTFVRHQPSHQLRRQVPLKRSRLIRLQALSYGPAQALHFNFGSL